MADLVTAFFDLWNMKARNVAVDLQNRMNQVNTDAKNKVRGASNVLSAAQGNLNRFIQSVNNSRRLDAGGKAMEENVMNFYRASDQNTLQNFSTSIEQAEQAGQMAAAAAVHGIEGSVVDDINFSTALRNSVITERMRQISEMEGSDAGRRAGAILSQTVGSLDQSLILDSIDYNQNVAHKYVGEKEGFARALFVGRLVAAYFSGGMSEQAFQGEDKTQDRGAQYSWNTSRDDSQSSYGLG